MLVLVIVGLGVFSLFKEKVEKLSDEELLMHYLDGDVGAFEELYQRHRKPIYSFILRSVQSPELAEELMQEVFMRLIQNAEKYVRDAKLTTWLYTIARNLCIDSFRRAKHRKALSLQQTIGRDESQQSSTLEAVLEDPHAQEASEKRVFQIEVQEALKICIQKLSDDQREVYLMREVSHMPYQDIAAVVGTSENTVKSRMRYALEHMKRHMKVLGFSLEDLKE